MIANKPDISPTPVSRLVSKPGRLKTEYFVLVADYLALEMSSGTFDLLGADARGNVEVHMTPGNGGEQYVAMAESATYRTNEKCLTLIGSKGGRYHGVQQASRGDSELGAGFIPAGLRVEYRAASRSKSFLGKPALWWKPRLVAAVLAFPVCAFAAWHFLSAFPAVRSSSMPNKPAQDSAILKSPARSFPHAESPGVASVSPSPGAGALTPDSRSGSNSAFIAPAVASDYPPAPTVSHSAGGRLLLTGGETVRLASFDRDQTQEDEPASSALAPGAFRGVASITVYGGRNPKSDKRTSPNSRKSSGQGNEKRLASGIILTEDGSILTNFHVVEGATNISVVLEGSAREFVARVVGTDAPTDLAVIKIEADGIRPAVIGDSSTLRVGDTVLSCMLNGLESSMTPGLISAVHVRESSLVTSPGDAGYEDLIQYDTAPPAESEGGPLLDTEGRVVGVNTVSAPAGKSGKGVGFAIRTSIAMTVAHVLMQGRKVERSFLGVRTLELESRQAKQLGIPEGNGVVVNRLVEGSPATRAGLKMVSLLPAGTSCTFDIVRNGSGSGGFVKETITAKLEPLPAQLAKE
jgi:S1-C subfamily serine protease